MTREKAINAIKGLMKACVPNSTYYIVGDMAIKALEQEPTTKNDLGVDAVSRKEVMEQCQEWRNLEFVKMTNPYYYLEKRLKALSSVTPIRPKGHWIPISSSFDSSDIHRCSVCGFEQDGATRFCPDCGADMREVEE